VIAPESKFEFTNKDSVYKENLKLVVIFKIKLKGVRRLSRWWNSLAKPYSIKVWQVIADSKYDFNCAMVVQLVSCSRHLEPLSCASMVRFSCNIVVEY